MNKLWTFGDSFIDSSEYTNNWVNQVADELNLKHCAFGMSGSSLDHMYSMVDSNLIGIHQDDVVIIALTLLGRAWLFKDHPELGTVLHVLNSNFDAETKKFATTYYSDHHNEELGSLHLKYFLTWLNLSTSHMKIKPIIIFSFGEIASVVINDIIPYIDKCNMTIVPGGLWELVSANEMNVDFRKLSGWQDHRYNHMSCQNHIVLKDKVVDFVQNGNVIDLSTEFHKNTAYLRDHSIVSMDPYQ